MSFFARGESTKTSYIMKVNLISFMILALVVCWPSVGLSSVKALLEFKLAQLAAGAKADAALKTAMDEADVSFMAAIAKAEAAMNKAGDTIAKFKHKTEVEIALQIALQELAVTHKVAVATYKAAIAEAFTAWETAQDKAETTWKAAWDEAGTETRNKTEAVMGEANAAYTDSIDKAEAVLLRGFERNGVAFEAAKNETENLTARRDIAATFRAALLKALDAYLADLAKARVAYMAAIIEAMQARNHLLKP